MKWHDHLAKKITVDEYYVHHRGIQFKVRYVIHNGFTVIEPLPNSHKNTSFEEWFKLRSDFNTRYDKPHWYKPLPRFGRDKKIVNWAVDSIHKAYTQYYQEERNAVPRV